MAEQRKRPDWFPRVVINEAAQPPKTWAGRFIERQIGPHAGGGRHTSAVGIIWDEEFLKARSEQE